MHGFNRVLLTALLAGLVSGCALHDVQAPEWRTSWASVRSVEVTERSATDVEVELSGSLPEGCSEFVLGEVTRVAPTMFDVGIASRRPASALCTQALKDFTATLRLAVSDPGTYTVRFESRPGDTFVFEVVVD